MVEVFCLDAGVWVKALVAEEDSDLAVRLLTDAATGGRIIAPAFCWAEVGAVLRKKMRRGEISVEEGGDAWSDFQAIRVEYVDISAVRDRAWALAARFGQPTLYDAAYLACTELVEASTREFWTADDVLLAGLGADRPPWVRHLHEIAPAA